MLKVHNESALWGASSSEIVRMALEEHAVAVLGSIDGPFSQIMLRLSSELELPIVNTGTGDPMITKTGIPWLLHNFPDDHQQAHALASYLTKDLKLKRIGVLRNRNRDVRSGVREFAKEAKSIGGMSVLELELESDKELSSQLRKLEESQVEGVVLWAEPAEAASILKQMREMNMQQPVFGTSRIAGPSLIANAGTAANGLVVTVAIDPTRADSKWLKFERDYRGRFNVSPDAYAAYAYDGMKMLITAIEKVGPDRMRINDVLHGYELESCDGVSGRAQFDRTLNNVASPVMARVEGARFVYWTAP